jgi:hypothetical protein
MVARALDLENGHPVLLRLRDSFLDVWRGHGTPQQLREPHGARRALQRALTVRRILRGVHADERAHWADAAPGWMAQHLEPGPLTPAARRG